MVLPQGHWEFTGFLFRVSRNNGPRIPQSIVRGATRGELGPSLITWSGLLRPQLTMSSALPRVLG